MRLAKILGGIWSVLLILACSVTPVTQAASEKNPVLREDTPYTVSKGDFNGTVPQFKRTNDAVKEEAVQKINAGFRNYLDTCYRDYKQDPDHKNYTIHISAQEKSIGNNLLSYAVYNSFYAKGAAHPVTAIEGFNFTLDKGERTTWKQLIQEQDLAAFSPAQITAALHNKQASDAGECSASASVTSEPDSYAFLVDEAGFIHILFQQYEVAPYAAGFITLNSGVRVTCAR